MIVTPIQSGSVGWLGTVNSNFQAIDAATQMKSAVVVQYLQADTPESPTHGEFWLDTSGTSQLLKVCVNASWVLLYQVVVGTIIVCDNEFWRITSTSDRERIPSLNFYSQGYGRTYFGTVDYSVGSTWAPIVDVYSESNLIVPNDTLVVGEAVVINKGILAATNARQFFICANGQRIQFTPIEYGEGSDVISEGFYALLYSVTGGCEIRFPVITAVPNGELFLIVTLYTYFSQG